MVEGKIKTLWIDDEGELWDSEEEAEEADFENHGGVRHDRDVDFCDN